MLFGLGYINLIHNVIFTRTINASIDVIKNNVYKLCGIADGFVQCSPDCVRQHKPDLGSHQGALEIPGNCGSTG